jgi:hypothetical protein
VIHASRRTARSVCVIVCGGVVMVTWDGIARPRLTDWIGLYAEGTGSGAYLAWIYVSCSQWSARSSTTEPAAWKV